MEAFLLSPGLSSSRVGRVTDGFLGGKVPCKVCTGKRVKVQMAFDFSSIASEAVRVHDSIVASTILLADATAPAAAAATDSGERAGIWQQFVMLIEKSIQGIHDGLASAGVPYAYGFSIIIFTIIVKGVTFPLGAQQMESTMKMQSAQPRMKLIQSKFRDNPQVMNQKIAQLYKDEGINPLAGCVPLLAQMPIFIALYRAVLNMSKDNILTEPFLWVPSLQGPVAQGGSIKDWLFPLVDGAPPIGWADAGKYLIFPMILLVSQFYSQKVLTPPAADKQTEQANQILKVLPFFLTWFSLTVPSGLTVYWVANNFLSTAQTLFLRQRFNSSKAATASVTASTDDDSIETESRPVSKNLGEADGFSTTKGSKKKSSKKRRK